MTDEHTCSDVWNHEQRKEIVATLEGVAAGHGARVDVACVMGDHVHMLLAPSGKGDTIMQLAGETKSKAWQACRKRGLSCPKWQVGMHDHILRPSERCGEEWLNICFYVLNNPVRARYVKNWWDYPFILVGERLKPYVQGCPGGGA
ncbi:MAG: hypothetical protein RDV41_10910 [Planctomycetota bacterium]|nr:hypothetical protein [Planctomycetota bacterium]